jgi:tetratricopeptide (TPR) repeat protein
MCMRKTDFIYSAIFLIFFLVLSARCMAIEENNFLEETEYPAEMSSGFSENDRDFIIEQVANQILDKLKDQKYKEVEDYFDDLISSQEKASDGIHKSYHLYDELGSKYKDSEINIYNQWCKATSHHSAFVVRGNYYIKDAWRDRGTAYAKYVSEEQFRLFYEKLKLAQEDLNSAYKINLRNAYTLNQEDPNIASSMLIVVRGLGLGIDERELWFQRGIEVDPSFYYLYKNKFQDLTHLWGGSIGESYIFAQSLFENPPKDSLAYTLLLDLFISIQSRNFVLSEGNVLRYETILKYTDTIQSKYNQEYPESNFLAIKADRLRGTIYSRNFDNNKKRNKFKDTDKAINIYRNILHIDDEYSHAWFMLGRLYAYDLREYKKAIEYYSKAIELNDSGVSRYINRASSYCSEKLYDECISDIEIAIERGAESWPLNNMLANAYYEKKDYDNAIKYYSRNLEYASDNPMHSGETVLLKRAKIYIELGKLTEAIADYKKLVLSYPSSPSYIRKLNDLNSLLEGDKNKIQGALHPSEKLRNVDSNGAQIELFNSLAVQFKQKNDVIYPVGSLITFDYFIVNMTNKVYQPPNRPLSYTLYTIQKIDGDGKIYTLPKASRRKFSDNNIGYGVGAEIFYPQKPIGIRQKYFFSKHLSTQDFQPGKYRFYVELRLLDENNKTIESGSFSLDFNLR